MSRIVIERTLGEDGEDRISYEATDGFGDELAILGLLELAKDTTLATAMGDCCDDPDLGDDSPPLLRVLWALFTGAVAVRTLREHTPTGTVALAATDRLALAPVAGRHAPPTVPSPGG